MRQWKCCTAILATVAVFSGCAVNTVISRTYDFNQVGKIGVARFDSPVKAVNGVEDMFAADLMEEGFTVVERAKLQKVVNEKKLISDGYVDPDALKKLGQIMGVDLILAGEIAYAGPEKKQVAVTEYQDTYVEPTYAVSRKVKADGTTVDTVHKTGTHVHKVTDKTPGSYTTSPQVSVVAKLIDVATAEVVWVGRVTKSAGNAEDAAQDAVDSLMAGLHKDLGKAKKHG